MTERESKRWTDDEVWRILLAERDVLLAKYPGIMTDLDSQIAKTRENIRTRKYPGISHQTLARLLMLAGRREDAIEAYRVMLRHSPPCTEEEVEPLFRRNIDEAIALAESLVGKPQALEPCITESASGAGVQVPAPTLRWVKRELGRLKAEVERLEQRVRLVERE
jgi:hypothetical protein